MTYQSFEDFVVWQKSRFLVKLIYRTLKECRDFSFRDQFCRAGLSIMNNIAEGFERQNNKEFRYFLYVSKGSCGEVRSMTFSAMDLGYITKEEFNDLTDLSIEISKMLAALIKKM